MNEKSFAKLFALVHDATTANVPSVQQDQVHKTMSDLISASPATTDPIMLLGYLAAGDGGGGVFIHDSGKAKADHDGGHVVDPGRAFTSHAGFLVVSSTVGTGCWVRQTRIWTPEMWGATGDGTTNDSDAWNAFSGFLAQNGGRGELSGHYLVPDADEAEINTTSAVEIEGLSETALIDGHTDGTRLFELTMGGLSLRNVRLRNTTLFLTDKVSTQDFDHVILENVSFDNSTADVHSAALRLRKSGETVPVLGLFHAVNVRIEGGLGGIEIESAIERFHVDDYVCRNISVPDEPAHFNSGNMRNLGYASGLSLGFDDPEFVELTRHGHIGAVFIEGVQDDREQEAGGDIANVDGVRIHAFDVKFDSIHVRDVNSFSKVDCTALYLKAHRCRGDRFTAIDAGFHEGMLTLKGDRRIAVESKSPGFNVSINDVQLIGTQEGFSGRAGVFCGVDDIHIGRLYMENVGGQVEDPYDAGSRLTGHGALFHTAETDSTAKKRLHIGTIEAVDCTLDNANGLSIRAVELQGYAEMTVDRIILDGMSQGGGFTGVDGRMVLVGIGGNIAFDHCEIGAILERNSSFSSTSPTLVQIEVDAASSGNVIIRNAFVTSDQIGIGIETAGDNAIDVLDLRGGNLEAATSSRLNTSPQVPDVIRVNGVKGLADLPARDENDPTVSSFTGDGSETDFALSAEPVSEAAILVLVDGVAQHQPDYSLDGTTLEFASAPVNGAAIEVRDLSLTAIADAEAVATVANIATEVQTVAGLSTEIAAVAADAADIGVVGAAIADVSAVAADIADVSTAADNLAAIQAAPAAATSAASSASAAATSASTAEDAAEDAATAALTAATIVTAQARFHNRFGKLPPAVLGLDLGEASLVDLERDSIGTRITPGGGPGTISVDTVRLTHDPETGEPLGLLLEPASTNLVQNSEDLTPVSPWVLGSNLTQVTGIVDPFGTNKAIRLTATATVVPVNSLPYFRSFTASGSYTNGISSWWIRRVSGTGTVRLLKPNNAHHTGVDASGLIDGTWRRVVENGAPGGSFFYTGIAVLTDGDAVEVAFPQTEDKSGTVPSSYIPTTGSAVTRNADEATVDLSIVEGFRPDGFTMVVEAVLGATDGTLIAIGTGTTAEVALELQSGELHMTGADSLDLTAATGLSPGDRITVAMRVAADDISVSADGAAAVTDSDHTINGGANKMQLGADLDSGDNLACTIRQIAFFGPLDDATLESMSGS